MIFQLPHAIQPRDNNLMDQKKPEIMLGANQAASNLNLQPTSDQAVTVLLEAQLA